MGWLISKAIALAASTFGIRLLLGLGVTLGSYAGFTALSSQLVSLLTGYYGGVTGDIASLCNLLGLGSYLGILAGAYTTRATIRAANVFLQKNSP